MPRVKKETKPDAPRLVSLRKVNSVWFKTPIYYAGEWHDSFINDIPAKCVVMYIEDDVLICESANHHPVFVPISNVRNWA